MSLKICLAVIVLGLASCVSKPNDVSQKRIIASTGQPFDEEKYKQILADMQSAESKFLTSYDGSEESEIEKVELAQDTQQGIENDITPGDEPVYTSGAEEQFIKNIGSETSVPELLAAAKKTISNTGTWAFKFIYIDKNGNEKILSQYNPHESLKPASTQKLFTGYLYLASGTESKSYSKNNLAAMLHVSHNEMADSALRRVAVQRGFNNDQMKNGLSVLKEFYGVLSDSSRYSPADGSGLSYANKVTVDVETSLLNRIYRGRYYSEFKMMLAHPSKQKCNYNTKRDQIGHRHPYHSTIGSRLNSLAGQVHAKTGTLNKTKALAGFVDVKDGGVIVFSVIGDYLKVGTGTAFAKINSVVEAHAKYTNSHIK